MSVNQTIKRRLWREGTIAAIAIAVLGAGTYGLSMIDDDYDQQSKALEGQVNAVTAETNLLKEKYVKVKTNDSLYQEALLKSAGDGLLLNRQLIRQKFDEFKNSYYLDSLHLNMASPRDLTEAKYKRDTSIMIASDVTVTLAGLTDEDIYGMLQALSEGLTGASKITKLTLTRQADVSEEALRTIRQKGTASLVSGDIKFTWYGLRSVETSTNGNATGK